MASKLKAKDPQTAEASKPKILVYGKSGIGKTWFALDFPLVYYIDTEQGANLPHYIEKLKRSKGAYMGPEDGALDPQVVLEQIQALATEKHNYKTVVIDSITKLFLSIQATEADRLAKAGLKNEFSADKKPAVAFMRRLVNWVTKLDMNVLFIAHEKAEWLAEAGGDRTQVGMTFDCWEKLEYELQLCLHARERGPQRTAYVRKTRLTGFPKGDTFDLSYPVFAERYGKDIIEKETTSIVLASEWQVAEINRLLEVVKMSEEDIGKWFTKASVEKWEEMTGEQIDKCISFIKSKIK